MERAMTILKLIIFITCVSLLVTLCGQTIRKIEEQRLRKVIEAHQIFKESEL